MRAEPGTGKLVPFVSGDELVETLGWPDAPPVELDDFVSVPSFDVHGELALALARNVVPAGSRDRTCAVSSSRTGRTRWRRASTWSTALLPSETPVVFTGAQRGADQPDADGPGNLRDAIRLACVRRDRRLRRRGRLRGRDPCGPRRS